MGSFPSSGLQFQLSALRQGKKLSQGGGMDGGGQRRSPTFPKGNTPETEVCCREGTGTYSGTYSFLVPQNLSSFATQQEVQ